MTRALLRDLAEWQVVSGVDLTRSEAAALNGTKLVTVTPDGLGWKVTVGQLVGAVRCGDLDVRVAPKVGAVKVLQLLARAHGIRGLEIDSERLGLAADAELSAVLAVLFEREAQHALARQPLRGYRTEDQSLPVVRGRIRLVDQALRRFGALTPIEVTVDEWTLDTDDNRRLRAAAQALLGLPGVPTPTVAGLRRIDRLLAGVQLPPRGTRLAPWAPTRLNTHLHGLLHLADLVLGGGSVEHRVGDVVAHGFVLNMAWVFETLVAQILREHCQRGDGRLLAQKEYQLDAADVLTIRPDIVIQTGGRLTAVADTKYKLLDDKGAFPNADAYQLVTYCLRLGLTEGHLIYTGEPTTLPSRFAIVGAEIGLLVHAVDLTAGVDLVETKILAVGSHFTTAAAAAPRLAAEVCSG